MLFKKVCSRKDLECGKRYINVELHKIYELIGINPIGNLYVFQSVDDEDDTLLLTFNECINVFRKFNVSDMELRVLLCNSMLDFILLMFENIKNKGEDENGK